MVSISIQGGAHERSHACVDADVLAPFRVAVDDARHENAMRPGHVTTRFKKDFWRWSTVSGDKIIENLTEISAERLDVERLVSRSVGDADAASEIDELESYAELVAHACYHI